MQKPRTRRRKISRRYLRPRWKYLSQDKKGILYIEGISVKDIVAKYGTPVYVLVESEIRERLQRMKKAFPYEKLKIQYASKCNSNLEILKIVREEGCEIDASSVGEIILALLVGFEPEQITFTNLYKSEQDITFAAQVGVQAITLDSLEEIKHVASVGEKLGMKIKVFLRFNPLLEMGSYSTKKQQYGIPIRIFAKAVSNVINSPYLELTGLHFHGGYITSPKVFSMAAKKLIKIAAYCKRYGVELKSIDLGGGIPVEYHNKKVFVPEDFGKQFVKYFRKLLRKYELPDLNLIFEPGKFIVANAGIGVVRVVSKKYLSTKKKMVVTDGSTYAFIPDPLIYHCYYDILPADKMMGRRTVTYDIAGCTCDCIDIIGSGRSMPKLYEGDILAIMDIGAYSNVMASNFNTLRRAPMVMVNEYGETRLIRRRDRYSEMFAPELDILKMGEAHALKKFYNLFRINIDKIWRGKNQKKGKKKGKKR